MKIKWIPIYGIRFGTHIGWQCPICYEQYRQKMQPKYCNRCGYPKFCKV